MSEESARCENIDQWLLERGSEDLPPELCTHLRSCSGCREQVSIHQSLIAAFREEEVPGFSTGFEAGLDRKLAAARIEPRTLTGWKKVAMVAYGVAAAGILAWAWRDVPLPNVDLSAPWVPVAVFLSAPMTLLLAAAASRWLPGPGSKLRRQALAL